MIVVPDAEKGTERFPDISAFISLLDKVPTKGSDLYAFQRATYTPEGGKQVVVAVKTFRPGSGNTQKFYIDMTKRAVELGDRINSLQHENIAPLFGVIYTMSELPAFVMPFYEHNLLTAIATAHYTEDRKLQWVKQIASAMEYLHAADPPVIHGNLHASNVFVDSQGQCLVSDIGTMGDLVSDFVFKVALNPRRASWTAPEIMPNLMPNQTGQDGTIQPYIPLTKKTDVFAFAMTLIEIYNGGNKPFGDNVSDSTIMSRIVKGERPDLPDAVLKDTALIEIVTGCWAVNPDKRLDMVGVCIKLGLTTYIRHVLGNRCSVV